MASARPGFRSAGHRASTRCPATRARRAMTARDPGFAHAATVAAPVDEAAAKPIHIAGGGAVRTGTASWTDPTMTARGVFYPEGANTAEERLRYYATKFPVVEVDST